MKVYSLAYRNLIHSKVRSLVAIAGIGFAVTLLLMQLGFLNSVSLSATLIYDTLDFDILLELPIARDRNREPRGGLLNLDPGNRGASGRRITRTRGRCHGQAKQAAKRDLFHISPF